MKFLSEIWSKELSSQSFRKKRALGNLVISSFPIIGIMVLGFQIPDLEFKAIVFLLLALISWTSTELALIRFMFKCEATPFYIQECFQIFLLLSNLGLMWLVVIKYINTNAY
jgi:predicted membrane protein